MASDAMHRPASDDADANDVEVVRLPSTGRRRAVAKFLLITIGVAMPIALTVRFAFSLGVDTSALTGGIAGALSVVLATVLGRWEAQQSLRDVDQRYADMPPRDALAGIFARLDRGMLRLLPNASLKLLEQRLGPLLRRIAQQRPGGVLRLTARPEKLPPAPEPEQHPCEPLRLNLADPECRRYLGLGEQAGPLQQMRLSYREAGRAVSGNRWLQSAFVSLILFGMAMWVVTVMLALLGRNTGNLMVYVGAVAIILLVLAFRTRRELWLVPGGVLERKARAFAGKWTLKHIVAAEAVLIVWEDRHIVIAGDRHGLSFALLVTPTLRPGLLRMWRSPLTPPPIERFSDLE